jgi:putative drug exporter of the RND superfamily
VKTLARWCCTHRFLVIGLWLMALAGLGLGQAAAGSAYNDNFAIPGTESTKAFDLLKQSFPNQAGETDTVVWRADPASAEHKRRMTDALAEISRIEHVSAVSDPRDSPDGTISYATVTFDTLAASVPADAVKQMVDTAWAARTEGLTVEVGGATVAEVTQEGGRSELYGLLAAMVILLLAFGSLLGMLLPIVVAIVALGCGLMIAGFVSHAMDIATVAPTMSVLIGLGVGIDYALFIVTRHRNGLKAGLNPLESVVIAVATSGRAVLFAGGTVCVALLGLLVLGVSFLGGIAIVSVIVVLMTALASVTLLPALLAITGKRVLSRRERRTTAAPVDGPWARWARFGARHAPALAAAGVIVMVALAVPILALRLGFADQGTQPPSSTSRKAYDMLATGFGPGFNGPLLLVGELNSPTDKASFGQLATQLPRVTGITHVSPPITSPDGKAGIIQIVPASSPQDEATSELITRLRSEVVPPGVHVGGMTALTDDFAEVLIGKLPMFLGVIVLLGGLLLMIAYRGVLVAVTAAMMNLLATGATFGVLVAVFQWGWGADLLDVGTGPVEAFLPVFLIAILFGLSMDYQVFLVSRMHEEWLRGKDNRRAVIVGVTDTSRVITAAATIMIFVFGSFVLGGQRFVAEVGLGLAVAVALDAFVLRTLLVPSVMHLLGKANWWPGRSSSRLAGGAAVQPEHVAGERPDQRAQREQGDEQVEPVRQET